MTIKSTNIVWQEGKISPSDRENFLHQKGVVLWFTGLSGSGKSTVSSEVELQLVKQGKFATVLDGDNVRHGLNNNLGFSDVDRKENIRRVGEVAKLFCEANVIVLTAFISPFRADRDFVRAIVPEGSFIEIYCAASVEECEKRDPKGLYKKARAGVIKDFTGISSPYESPENPELVLHTGKESLDQSVKKVMAFLKKKGTF